MASIQGSDHNSCSWVGRKPSRPLGGMSDVLAIASDLGYSRFRPPPSQVYHMTPKKAHIMLDVKD